MHCQLVAHELSMRLRSDKAVSIAAGSPPRHLFASLLESIRAQSDDCDTERDSSFGAGKKRRRMLWCLGEGYRAIIRSFLRAPHNSTLLLDAYDGRLLVRFKVGGESTLPDGCPVSLSFPAAVFHGLVNFVEGVPERGIDLA